MNEVLRIMNAECGMRNAELGATNKEVMQKMFDHLAHQNIDALKRRHGYFHQEIARLIQGVIPPGQKVLDIGSGNGDTLATARPSDGVGLDLSSEMIRLAKSRYPHFRFLQGDLETGVPSKETFDWIIISGILGYLGDIQHALRNARAVSHPASRIFILYYNRFWMPFLHLAERLRLKRPQPIVNRLTLGDVEHMLDLAGFEVVRHGKKILFPFYLPLISHVCNRWLTNLGFGRLALVEYLVARPRQEHAAPQNKSVSVVIPARNERGNIEDLIRRTPSMGSRTEIIFVEGNSSDGTREEIERCLKVYGDRRNIKLFGQDGRGKANAMWKGFCEATGEIVMILDADMTVRPEDLPKFYDIIASGKADFVLGNRLAYPLPPGAMRFLNYLGNVFFGWLTARIVGQKFHDSLCGTKVMFKTDWLRMRALPPRGRTADPFCDFDLIFGASELHLKFKEVPLRYFARTYGATNISRFSDGWLLLKMCREAFAKLVCM